MTRFHTGIIVVLTMGVALLGADRFARSNSDRELLRQLKAIQEAQRDLREEAENLRAQQHRSASSMPHSWNQPAIYPVPVEKAPEEAAPRAAAPTPPSQPPLTTEEMQASMDREFFAAPRDRMWGSRAEDLVRTAVGRTLPAGSRLETLSCNGFLCRLETSHPSQGEYQKFLEDSLNGAETGLWGGATFSSIVHHADNEEVTAVSFIAREGTPLPKVGRP